MSDRGERLWQTASGQTAELLALLSCRDERALHLPCPGREKLGDGTVAASAAHAATNYIRIASFAASVAQAAQAGGAQATGARDEPTPPRGHSSGRLIGRIAGMVRRAPHDAAAHRATHAHSTGAGAGEVGLTEVLDALESGRRALATLKDLGDAELDTVPPAGEMRFCDGRRTLEQILTSMLRHQAHQVSAVRAALA